MLIGFFGADGQCEHGLSVFRSDWVGRVDVGGGRAAGGFIRGDDRRCGRDTRQRATSRHRAAARQFRYQTIMFCSKHNEDSTADSLIIVLSS